jgi:uncharacterized protein YbjT (DUF2867 family)
VPARKVLDPPACTQGKHRKSRTLAVTGGTGFVGEHLLRLALGGGYDVHALTRGWKPPEDEIDWVNGALDRPETLVKLCTGADAVIHVAGLISGSKQAFEAVNVGGTAAMIDAARKAGVRRFIHVSSLAAREPELSEYGRSKAKSERLVAASGLEWTVIRPPRRLRSRGSRDAANSFKIARRGFVALPLPVAFSPSRGGPLPASIPPRIDEPETVIRNR